MEYHDHVLGNVPALPQPVSEASLHPGWKTRFCAGWLAGALSEGLYGHPLSTVQAHRENAEASWLLRPSLRGLLASARAAHEGAGTPLRGTLAALRETGELLVRRDGAAALYRGAWVQMFAGSCVGSAAFTSYGSFRHWLRHERGLSPHSSAVLAGGASGLVVATAMAPLELVTLRLQLAVPETAAVAWSERLAIRARLFLWGPPVLSLEALTSRGWHILWSAAGATAAREVCYYAPYYATYEQARSALGPFAPEWVGVLVGGGAAGLAGALCSQPIGAVVGERHAELERLLRQQQKEPSTVRAMVRSMVQEGGAKVLFTRGLQMSLLRAVPLNGLAFLTYELAVHHLRHG